LIWNFVDYGTIIILMINQGMTVIKQLLNVWKLQLSDP
jgi:hypothetical protein